jgi:hypothetical protein
MRRNNTAANFKYQRGYRNQESGIRTQELQEFRSQRIWELGEDFSQVGAGPRFSDKDLARLFCNSCNS